MQLKQLSDMLKELDYSIDRKKTLSVRASRSVDGLNAEEQVELETLSKRITQLEETQVGRNSLT